MPPVKRDWQETAALYVAAICYALAIVVSIAVAAVEVLSPQSHGTTGDE